MHGALAIDELGHALSDHALASFVGGGDIYVGLHWEERRVDGLKATQLAANRAELSIAEYQAVLQNFDKASSGWVVACNLWLLMCSS